MSKKNKESAQKGDEEQPSLYNKNDDVDEDSLKPHKTIRIAVTGDVFVTKLEKDIIDTPEFQRLRFIKQLTTTYLVYPSAIHTRFEHSLGVLQTVEYMMKCIGNNRHVGKEQKTIEPQERKIIRLAALLHDIANIPFGHTLEDETCVIESYQEDKDRFDIVLGKKTTIGKKIWNELGEAGYNLLRDILTAKKDETPEPGDKAKQWKYVWELDNHAYMYDIVKNTVCADLLDYLKRDFYFCNLPLTIPDRFLHFLYIHNGEFPYIHNGKKMTREGKRLAIKLWKRDELKPRQDIISELIQLLENRYFLSERVYFHHAKIIGAAMIGAAVWDAQQNNLLTLDNLHKFGDDELLNYLRNLKDADGKDYTGPAKTLADKIYERKLYKCLGYAIKRKDIKGDNPLEDPLERLKKDYHDNAENRTKTENILCEIIGVKTGSILIYCPDPDMNLKPAEMFVTWHGGIKKFKDIDNELVQNKVKAILDSHKELWQLQVLISPEIADDKQKKYELRLHCKRIFEKEDPSVAIKETLESVARSAGLTDELDSIYKNLTAAAHNGNPTSEITRQDIEKTINEYLQQKKKQS
ncbi:MAG: HD domain-containing protein [Deltaproteobacteria bacterium]|nr:HD domain-containing protein [Deltaproteobacteria bacterium]